MFLTPATLNEIDVVDVDNEMMKVMESLHLYTHFVLSARAGWVFHELLHGHDNL